MKRHSPHLAWVLSAGLLAAASATQAAEQPAASTDRSWNFQAALDGRPIGHHRFSLDVEGDRKTLVSEADFAVKIIGITAYRYHHKATEHWRGDCLSSLNSTTDDDGKAIKVSSEQKGDSYSVSSPKPASAAGCVMSYAYWNPSIQMQTRLLNAQTGEIEPVKVAKVGSGTVEVRGQAVTATQFRISGPNPPIDVWYSGKGEWVGLDAEVSGGRKLSYRIR